MSWDCLDCGSRNPPANVICGSVACQERRLREVPQTPATRSRKSRNVPATSDAGETLDLGSEPSPKKPRHSYPAEFEVFWKVYPRHKDKLAAFKAWKRTVDAGTDADVLREGAERYRNDPQRRAEELRFTKHAERWLNAGSWDDEDDAALRSVTSLDLAPPIGSAEWQAERDAEYERIRAEEVADG